MAKNWADALIVASAVYNICSKIVSGKGSPIKTLKPVSISKRSLEIVNQPTKEPVVLPIPHIKSDLKPSKVPTSRIGRLFQYGALAVGVGTGMATEFVKRAGGMSDSQTSLLLSGKNVDKIVKRLLKMRGAALKLGQMLSIQDSHLLSPELEKVLLQVQNSANYMPDSQLQQVMKSEFGNDWKSNFKEFNMMPFAAASIGQVHQATMHDGTVVAVKVQYPGVQESIDSDLNNLKNLLLFSSVLPKGLYLENTIKVARRELNWECDYEREAEWILKFSNVLKRDSVFKIPKLIKKVSGKRVLTTELVPGIPLGQLQDLSQVKRDKIGKSILELCLRELFEFNFMQTDPNWSNFLYDQSTDSIYLLDFGASRDFPTEFLNGYINVIKAAKEKNVEKCIFWSRKLGFLTGLESEQMTRAHVNSLITLAEPFATRGVFDFGSQDITTRVKSEIPTMLRERLTPPPDETYSLHRKLSGCFLLCSKLKSRVYCNELFNKYS